MRRTDLLREDILDTAPAVCPERARLITESYRQTEGQPSILRKARAFAAILEGMTVCIRRGELVVGNQASQPRAAPVFPEYSADWVLEELDDFASRSLDPFEVSEEAKAELRDVAAYWCGKTHNDRVRATVAAAWPAELLPALDLKTLGVNQVFRNVTGSTGDGHTTPNYQRVIEVGLSSIAEEARARSQALDLTQPDTVAKRLFYRGVTISCEAAIGFAQRFAAKAEEMAGEELDPERRAELEEAARACRRAPHCLPGPSGKPSSPSGSFRPCPDSSSGWGGRSATEEWISTSILTTKRTSKRVESPTMRSC